MGVKNVDSQQRQQSQQVQKPRPTDTARATQSTTQPTGGLFQKVLETTKLKPSTEVPYQDAGAQQASTDRAAPKVQEQFRDDSRQDSGMRREKAREKEDVKDSDAVKDGGKKHAKVAEQRVTGRPTLGERGHQQQGGGQEQGGFGGRRGYGFHQVLRQSGYKKGVGQESTKEAAFLKSMQEVQKTHEMPPAKITQETMNQIIAYIHVLVRKGDEKEVNIALREKFFKGLRLKVAKKGDKVSVTFLTSSSDVHSLFASEKNRLRDALTEKNIEVGDIDVILT